MSRIGIVLMCALVMLPLSARASDDVQARIFQYFLTKAQAGDANAEFIVGNRYETGNGVLQDRKKAYEWYQKAAAQGNQPAQDMLDGRKRAQEAAEKSKQDAEKERAEAARAAAERAEKARIEAERMARARQQAKRAARAAIAARAVRTVASAAPVQPQRSAPVNAMKILLGGRWFLGQGAAEYLPSAVTSCLQSSATQIVCFSEELSRNVGDSALTYTVKSTLTNFGQDGSFTVDYMYDVTDIKKASADSAPQGDGPGLRLGWQAPGLTLRCKASNGASVSCATQQNRLLQFTRR